MQASQSQGQLPPMAGWLKKRGAKGPILDFTWKHRYFKQTSPVYLSYFVDASATQQKGQIDLVAVTDIVRGDDSKYGFSIKTPNRTYVLQCGSEQERQYWMSGLALRCPKLPGYKQATSQQAVNQVGPQPQMNIQPRVGPNAVQPAGTPPSGLSPPHAFDPSAGPQQPPLPSQQAQSGHYASIGSPVQFQQTQPQPDVQPQPAAMQSQQPGMQQSQGGHYASISMQPSQLQQQQPAFQASSGFAQPQYGQGQQPMSAVAQPQYANMGHLQRAASLGQPPMAPEPTYLPINQATISRSQSAQHLHQGSQPQYTNQPRATAPEPVYFSTALASQNAGQFNTAPPNAGYQQNTAPSNVGYQPQNVAQYNTAPSHLGFQPQSNTMPQQTGYMTAPPNSFVHQQPQPSASQRSDAPEPTYVVINQARNDSPFTQI